jgi:Domain of Unknown Function (DUF1080)
MLLDIMRTQMWKFFAFVILVSTAVSLYAQQSTGKPEDTEVWQPDPKVVTPGTTCGASPSDAIILFDGKNLDEWVSAQDRSAPAKWIVANSVVTVNKAAGNIETKRTFSNYQFHIEWRIPENDTKNQKWRPLDTKHNSFGYLAWSPDSNYVFFDTVLETDSGCYRLHISDSKLERLVDLKKIRTFNDQFGPSSWTGLGPSETLLLPRDISTQEIYAFDLQLP